MWVFLCLCACLPACLPVCPSVSVCMCCSPLATEILHHKCVEKQPKLSKFSASLQVDAGSETEGPTNLPNTGTHLDAAAQTAKETWRIRTLMLLLHETQMKENTEFVDHNSHRPF